MPNRSYRPRLSRGFRPPTRRIGAMTTEVRAPSVPIYLAGEFVEAGTPLEVRDPATGELVGTTWQAGPDELERATAAAVEAGRPCAGWPATSAAMRWRTWPTASRATPMSWPSLLTRESGKPIKDARGEVARGSLTFRTAAEEALRINGEWLPLDWNATSKGRRIVRRYPIGPVAGISPFNFPLNLAAHKVAPALAAGCSIVLKPPSKDPLVMLRVAQYLSETGLPRGAVSVLPMDRPTGDAMVRDERFAAQLHWLAERRLEDEGRPARRRWCWSWAATRASWPTRPPTWSGRSTAWSTAPSRTRGRCASACSASTWSTPSSRSSPAASPIRCAPCKSAARSIRPPTWDRWSMRRRSAARTNGCRRPWPMAPAP